MMSESSPETQNSLPVLGEPGSKFNYGKFRQPAGSAYHHLAFPVFFAVWMMFGVIGIPNRAQLGLVQPSSVSLRRRPPSPMRYFVCR